MKTYCLSWKVVPRSVNSRTCPHQQLHGAAELQQAEPCNLNKDNECTQGRLKLNNASLSGGKPTRCFFVYHAQERIGIWRDH